ncbi:MAG: UDP-N-acetylmuramoyl-L-alanyl-D-glutamate--2,6-diaminopimelate ligase [Actinobacteria bacterium]|nr:UDP-N-acetylmuramoyl-L-alanyl-D-glutamate--2,6-diaminopimelate ligase [Actinomycetota bacterium]
MRPRSDAPRQGPTVSTTLSVLAAELPGAQLRGDDVELRDAAHDSRQAGPEVLFCAVPGATTDGHDHAPAAVAAGSPALLVERWLDLEVPQLLVPSVRAAMGPAAARVHDVPSRALTVVGITGTNGKTTTTYLLESAFGAAGWGTGTIGTVETRIHGEAQPGVRTTPEGPDLQRLLARMRDRGVDAVGMEVSSHGLAYRRVDGTRFAVAVFTNLTQDHLDFHGSMEAYFDAKARLFTPELADRGIVCVDDDWGRRLAAQATIPVTTFGRGEDADRRIAEVAVELAGATAVVTGPDGDTEVRTRLVGEHNVTNAVGAYLAAVAAGIGADTAAAGVAACAGVPGRLERVDRGQPFAVLVDYAHTPDALEHVVRSTRPLLEPGGRLHLVIGAGGDRDRGKRPLMGAVAAQADVAVLTSDNPRSEDPQAILDAMRVGADEAVAGGAPGRVVVEVDRRRAIALALEGARAGDVVVIAGKGHETGQTFADRTVPFDDRLVAAELLGASDVAEVAR